MGGPFRYSWRSAFLARVGDVERPVDVHIHKPFPCDRCWACRYAIHWPDNFKSRYIHGHDALQALVLTLQIVGVLIYTSDWHQDGLLRAYEKEQGYGFPPHPSIADVLVGTDIPLQPFPPPAAPAA